jgi:bifunctional oligoribonuclease and PAP phosphatase NrnA
VHALSSLGKTVTLIKGDSPLPNSLKCLPGFNLITPQNFFEIDLIKFDLFLILDASALSQISRLGNIEFPKTLNTIIIDHHYSNTQFASLNLVDPTYPATGQLIYDLLTLWQVNLTPEIAICLFIAIYTDTGGFKYPNTGKDTFLAASHLADINPKFPEYISQIESSYSPKTLEFISLGLQNIQTFYSNQVAISLISFPELQKLNLQKSDFENIYISETMRMVSGWKITASLIEKDPGIISISLRTLDGEHYHVGKIAVATGFGGGHPAAAGVSLTMPFDQAKSFLLSTISQVYPELGTP